MFCLVSKRLLLCLVESSGWNAVPYQDEFPQFSFPQCEYKGSNFQNFKPSTLRVVGDRLLSSNVRLVAADALNVHRPLMFYERSVAQNLRRGCIMKKCRSLKWMLAFWVIALGCQITAAKDEDGEALAKWKGKFDRTIFPLMKQRCIECHSGDQPDGELDLGKFTDGETAASQMEMWDEVGKRIRLNEMPPAGSPQLDDSQKGQFYRWLDSRPSEDLCSKLANEETQAWYQGFVMSRRLTRTEYLNGMRDLLGISVDAGFQIPSDGAGGEGFDTNGGTLFTSPIHIEQYLAATIDTLNRALSDSPPTPDHLEQGNPKGDNSSPETAGPVPASRKLNVSSGMRDAILCSQPSSTTSPTQAAEEVVRQFARRAWRRPVGDDEVQRLVGLFANVFQQSDDFLVAIKQPLTAILISPNFLFVVETESEQGGVQRLTQHQLATRLALFLWSSVPDAVLLDAADAGELDTQPQVLFHTNRMLNDDRAQAIGENFGLQWLGLANFLETVRPDAETFPEYNVKLASDLRQEVIQTVSTVFRQDRSLLELVDSPQVYISGRLAKFYGLSEDSQALDAWQEVLVAGSPRGGIITSGAVLVNASYPRRTSPVLRGRWLLEEILGSKVPPPPPGVPALEEAVSEDVVSLRQRLEIHRKNPECASCHNRMDPLGFGLENFDAIGRWREEDNGQAIDASGTLPSGQSFQGPSQLKQILLERSGDFERHLIKKMLGFALGRELNKFDDCVVDQAMESLQENGHRSRLVIETIVTSYAFQHRYFKAKK